ncbi:peptidoglycan recognition protein [Amyelois transitella]|uniref:peptidoglycan recognition protein n=1 Tax=Amyelois transitella TaxID=680683 RepID=UPI00298FA399|nr:peptidoglycan recognition protein [Amyelois transitella]
MKVFICFVLIAKIMVEASDKCNVIPIAKWAGEPTLRTKKLPQSVPLVVIQHTASPDCVTDEQCEGVLRGIRYYHRHEMGFQDVGQSFLIGGNGKVYEGAGWTRVGAHTRNYNNRSIGISFVGNFMNKLPTSSALQAAMDLIACGVKSQYLSEDYHVMGHRQLSPTLSPGDALQEEINIWPHFVQNIS